MTPIEFHYSCERVEALDPLPKVPTPREKHLYTELFKIAGFIGLSVSLTLLKTQVANATGLADIDIDQAWKGEGNKTRVISGDELPKNPLYGADGLGYWNEKHVLDQSVFFKGLDEPTQPILMGLIPGLGLDQMNSVMVLSGDNELNTYYRNQFGSTATDVNSMVFSGSVIRPNRETIFHSDQARIPDNTGSIAIIEDDEHMIFVVGALENGYFSAVHPEVSGTKLIISPLIDNQNGGFGIESSNGDFLQLFEEAGQNAIPNQTFSIGNKRFSFKHPKSAKNFSESELIPEQAMNTLVPTATPDKSLISLGNGFDVKVGEVDENGNRAVEQFLVKDNRTASERKATLDELTAKGNASDERDVVIESQKKLLDKFNAEAIGFEPGATQWVVNKDNEMILVDATDPNIVIARESGVSGEVRVVWEFDVIAGKFFQPDVIRDTPDSDHDKMIFAYNEQKRVFDVAQYDKLVEMGVWDGVEPFQEWGAGVGELGPNHNLYILYFKIHGRGFVTYLNPKNSKGQPGVGFEDVVAEAIEIAPESWAKSLTHGN